MVFLVSEVSEFLLGFLLVLPLLFPFLVVDLHFPVFFLEVSFEQLSVLLELCKHGSSPGIAFTQLLLHVLESF